MRMPRRLLLLAGTGLLYSGTASGNESSGPRWSPDAEHSRREVVAVREGHGIAVNMEGGIQPVRQPIAATRTMIGRQRMLPGQFIPGRESQTLDFEWNEVGSLPGDFVIVYDGLGIGEQRIESENGNRHLRTVGQRSWSLNMRLDFHTDLPSAVRVQWRMRVDEDLHDYTYTDRDGARYAHLGAFTLKNWAGQTAGIGIDKYWADRRIVARCPAGGGFPWEVALGAWTEFRMDVDFEAGWISMYADGELFCERATGWADLSGRWNAWDEPSGMLFSSGNSGLTVTRFDDILVEAR